MKKQSIYISIFISFIVPVYVNAQGIQQLISSYSGVLAKVPAVLVGLALVFFLWGLAKFILVAGNEKKIAEGKNLMIWGIVAIFVMVSIWGIVNILQGTFGVQTPASSCAMDQVLINGVCVGAP
jgi:hypothetical protein